MCCEKTRISEDVSRRGSVGVRVKLHIGEIYAPPVPDTRRLEVVNAKCINESGEASPLHPSNGKS